MEELHNTIVRDQVYSDLETQRTIVDLIDVETGECVDASMLDSMSEGELTLLKEVQSLAKRSGKYKYVCAVCGQPLRLDSRQFRSKRYLSYFFSHYSNGDDCPLKTSSDAVDPIQSTINWYGKFKEGKIHEDMRKTLMTILENDSRFTNVESYPTINIYGENIHWHKPDVAAMFYGNQLVFETLMYNAFISAIVDKNSFYRMANSYLLWLFPYFSIDNQAMHERDVYYTHRRNIFVFDKESYYQTKEDKDMRKPRLPQFIEEGYQFAQEESIKRGRLMLNCYWQIPVIVDGNVKIEWHRKLVAVEDLTFDAIKKDVFFHNSDYDFKEVADPIKRELIENWERAKEDRWSNISIRLQERKKVYESANEKKLLQEKKAEIVSRVDAGELVPEPFEESGKYGYKVEDVVFIKPQYRKAFPFYNGVAIVIKGSPRDLRRGLINYKNEALIDIVHERMFWENEERTLLSVGYQERFSLCNIHGDDILGFQLSFIKRSKEFNGFFIKSYETGGFGLISPDGQVVVEPKYDGCTAKDGVLTLRLGSQKKQFYLNNIVPKMEVVSKLSSDRFIVEKMMFHGIADADLNIIVPLEYLYIEHKFGNFLLLEKKGSFGLVTTYALFDDGFNNIQCIYDDVRKCPNGKFVLLKMDGLRKKYSVANEQGKLLFPFVTNRVKTDSEGNAIYKETILSNGYCIKDCFGVSGLFESKDSLNYIFLYDEIQLLRNGNLLVKNNGMYGIVTVDGNIVYPLLHKKTDFTEDGEIMEKTIKLDSLCTKVYVLSKYALSDINGNKLTNFIYDDIALLSKGIYKAKTENGVQLLDATGNAIVPLYDLNTQFTFVDKERFIIREGDRNVDRCGVVGKNGDLIVPIEFNEIIALPNGNFKVRTSSRYGIYSHNGDVLVRCEYKEIVTNESGDVIPTYITLNENFLCARMYDKYALASVSHQLLTKYEFDNCIVVLDDNYFIGVNEHKNLIDESGNIVVIPDGYSVASVINRSYVVIKNYYSMGILLMNGSILIPCKYETINLLPNGNWKVKSSNGLFGVYDKEGNEDVECVYEELLTDEAGEIVPSVVEKDGMIYAARMFDKYAFCSGGMNANYVYDKIIPIKECFFVCYDGEKRRVLDKSANLLLSISDVEVLDVYDENTFLVKKNSLLGVVSSSCEFILDCKFRNIVRIANAHYKTIDSSGYGLYDEHGQLVFFSKKPLVLDENSNLIKKIVAEEDDFRIVECSGLYAISSTDDIPYSKFVYDLIHKFTDDLYIVKKNDNYGIISKNGDEVLPIKYANEFTLHSEDIIQFRSHKGLYGLCDTTGKIIEKPNYRFIRENNPGVFKLFWDEGAEKKSKFLNLMKSTRKDKRKKIFSGSINTRSQFEINKTYKGTITGIEQYGIFVSVKGCGFGLVHVNNVVKAKKQLSDFSKNQTISVKVIRIKEDGKIDLSLSL